MKSKMNFLCSGDIEMKGAYYSYRPSRLRSMGSNIFVRWANKFPLDGYIINRLVDCLSYFKKPIERSRDGLSKTSTYSSNPILLVKWFARNSLEIFWK